MRNSDRYWKGPAAAGLLGLLVYWVKFGFWHLWPGSQDWLFSTSDSASYLIGWEYFRHEPWHWPPGLIQNCLWPVGTSIGLVDAIPLVAIPLKTLRPFLPESFQYFGLWTALCYVLQGVVGYWLAGTVCSRSRDRLLGALLFLLVPARLNRGTHVALASHWLILLAFVIYLGRGKWLEEHRLGASLALLAVTSLVHPYLMAMVAAILLARLVRAAHGPNWKRSLLRGSWTLALAAVTLLLPMYLAGMLQGVGHGPSSLRGYGEFSMNLNAAINPMGTSPILKTLPTLGDAQVEGYNYFGLGLLFLLALGLCGLVTQPRILRGIKPLLPLAVVCCVLAAYAPSNVVSLGNRVIFQFDIPASLHGLAATFRASGRFFWPMAYGILLVGLYVSAQVLRPRMFTSVLAVALALQCVDMQRNLSAQGLQASTEWTCGLNELQWSEVMTRASSLQFLPPRMRSFQRKDDFVPFTWWGSRSALPMDIGGAANVSGSVWGKVEQGMEQRILSGQADDGAVYVVHDRLFGGSWTANFSTLTATHLDGYMVLHPRTWNQSVGEPMGDARTVGLAEYLSSATNGTLLLAVRGDASKVIQGDVLDTLHRMGSRIPGLARGEAYVCFIRGGRVQFEMNSTEEPVRTKLEGVWADAGVESQSPEGGVGAVPGVVLASAGRKMGDFAEISWEDLDLCLDSRGVNTVLVDERGVPSEQGAFDAVLGGFGVVVAWEGGS